jgi:archaetidylinositol phosphate synthase
LSRLERSRKKRLRQETLCELVFRPVAHVVVLALAPLRVPPPAVVLTWTACGIGGAVELARGHLVVAALLVQLKTVLDNADGQLARLTGRVTVFGRYLDSECDLLVDAALFAGLGWYTKSPLAAAAGFVALTLVLSVNFNVERLARGARASSDPSVLGRVYSVLYGWQDRAVERFVDRRTRDGDASTYHDGFTVSVLANLGMSTQLAVFGASLALGHPVVYVWLLLAQVAVVVMLFARREALMRSNREVVLEHR